MKKTGEAKTEEAQDALIEEYLCQHPDFFLTRQALLKDLYLPRHAGAAIPLAEYQVRVLREENRQLNRKLEHLIEAAAANERIQQRIQQLIVALVDVRTDIGAFFDALYCHLHEQLATDFVAARIFGVASSLAGERSEFAEYDAQVYKLFENVLEASQPVCGRLAPPQAAYLFPNEKIGSAILIPLAVPEPRGLLALASQDVARYHNGMATDLMTYLGQIVSHFLRAWLKSA